jgi:deazaflavin-dependent oxidoreductase (nitroreductase family)
MPPRRADARQETAVNPVTRKAVQRATSANVWLYRRTNGQVGGRGIGRLPLLLVTVPGRKTGTPHTVPVAYLDHDGGWIVVGSGMGGSKRIPQWILNLETAGQGHVQIGAREHHITAHLPTSAEQGMLWPQDRRQAPTHAAGLHMSDADHALETRWTSQCCLSLIRTCDSRLDVTVNVPAEYS